MARRTAGADQAEQRANVEDERSQEAGTTSPVPLGRWAYGYVYATHPDTGTDVVFKPGELLPTWATEG